MRQPHEVVRSLQDQQPHDGQSVQRLHVVPVCDQRYRGTLPIIGGGHQLPGAAAGFHADAVDDASPALEPADFELASAVAL